jgi:methylphosphotriester-DNA--protein-cysteine methyltransferase
MLRHLAMADLDLRNKIRNREINFAGNSKLKIYGTLRCKSGKRMKRENRVFFMDADDATDNNYRPCGNCMKKEYKTWISLVKK